MRLARAALAALAVCALFTSARGDDWPQWMGPKRDAVWREKGILDELPKDGPKRLWAEKIGGGYAGPGVADGRVFVHDRTLDKGEKDDENPFARANSKGKERVICFDAASGKQLWLKEYACTYKGVSYPAGPRATPTIDGDKVYTLGAMGDLQCRKVKDGELVWEKSLMKEYKVQPPGWGFSASVLIDGDNLITLVGRKVVVVALDKTSGKENWKALELTSGDVGYCPPMIYEFDKKRHLVVWTPESVNGLDPSTGKSLWSHDWSINSNLTIPTPRKVGEDKLFLTSFYNGCRLLEINGDSPKVIWKSEGGKGRPLNEQPKNTDKLHSIMVTPFVKGGHVYGIDSYGELRCLDLKDGKRVWTDLTATGTGKKLVRWANAFIVEHGDRFFLFNEKGELIIAKLSPKGYEEVSRAKLLEPTYSLGGGFGPARKVVWSHPAFANKCIFARNDKEVVCYSLAAE